MSSMTSVAQRYPLPALATLHPVSEGNGRNAPYNAFTLYRAWKYQQLPNAANHHESLPLLENLWKDEGVEVTSHILDLAQSLAKKHKKKYPKFEYEPTSDHATERAPQPKKVSSIPSRQKKESRGTKAQPKHKRLHSGSARNNKSRPPDGTELSEIELELINFSQYGHSSFTEGDGVELNYMPGSSQLGVLEDGILTRSLADVPDVTLSDLNDHDNDLLEDNSPWYTQPIFDILAGEPALEERDSGDIDTFEDSMGGHEYPSWSHAFDV